MRANSGFVCYVAGVQSTQSGPGEFARLLAAIQKRTGLSHQDIADATGVNRSQVWRWVNSGSAPGYEPVRRLTAWLLDERPEVAEMASGLLPAAGYETAPAAAPGPRRPSGDPEFTDEMLALMAPHLPGIEIAIEVARRRYPGEELTGAKVFPKSPADADSWDRLAAGGHAPEVTARRLAAVQAWEAELAAGESGGTAAGLPAPRVTRR